MAFNPDLFAGGSGILPKPLKSPLVLHSASKIFSGISNANHASPCRRLELSIVDDKNSVEDAIAKGLVDRMLETKENINYSLLTSLRNKDLDPVNKFRKILIDCLEGQLQINIPELNLSSNNGLKEESCTVAQSPPVLTDLPTTTKAKKVVHVSLRKRRLEPWNLLKRQEKELLVASCDIKFLNEIKVSLSIAKKDFEELNIQFFYDLKQIGSSTMNMDGFQSGSVCRVREWDSPQTSKISLVLHSASKIFSGISNANHASPCRRLELSIVDDKNSVEDAIAKGLVDRMLETKENINYSLLTSLRNKDLDPVNKFRKILIDCLEGQLQINIPELNLSSNNGLKEESCTVAQSPPVLTDLPTTTKAKKVVHVSLRKRRLEPWNLLKRQEKELLVASCDIKFLNEIKVSLSIAKKDFEELNIQFFYDLKQIEKLVEEMSTAAQGMAFNPDLFAGGSGILPKPLKSPLVLHSASKIFSGISNANHASPCRRLELSIVDDKNSVEDAIAKGLVDRMLETKENINYSLLTSLRNKDLDPVNKFRKILIDCLEGQLQINIPELNLSSNNGLKEESCTVAQSPPVLTDLPTTTKAKKVVHVSLRKRRLEPWNLLKRQEKELLVASCDIKFLNEIKVSLSIAKKDFEELNIQFFYDLKQIGSSTMNMNIMVCLFPSISEKLVEEMSTAAQGLVAEYLCPVSMSLQEIFEFTAEYDLSLIWRFETMTDQTQNVDYVALDGVVDRQCVESTTQIQFGNGLPTMTVPVHRTDVLLNIQPMVQIPSMPSTVSVGLVPDKFDGTSFKT
ncbi:hypothetical protein V2J09_016644 [Rumex salicifolius]